MSRRARRRVLALMGSALAVLAVAFACTPPAPPSALPANQAKIDRGREIYNSTCIACHGGPTGGSLMDYPPRHNANGHTWHHTDCELKTIVKDGGNAMTEQMRQMMASPGASRMPSFKDRLSDEDIDAVLAYIKTMWTDTERGFQAQITREAC